MELIIIILLVACIVWLVVKVRRSALASEHATLNAAWRVVLDDPNYKERRALEERKRAVKEQERALEDDARALVEGKGP
jgi:hypothetical protein